MTPRVAGRPPGPPLVPTAWLTFLTAWLTFLTAWLTFLTAWLSPDVPAVSWRGGPGCRVRGAR